MRTQQPESRPFSLCLWMDEESAATAAEELVRPEVLERHFARQQPADEVAPQSPTPWAYLHRPVVPLVDGNPGASA